jgi:hypothetical protein
MALGKNGLGDRVGGIWLEGKPTSLHRVANKGQGYQAQSHTLSLPFQPNLPQNGQSALGRLGLVSSDSAIYTKII